MTLQLEIKSENDLSLFLALAQRLKIKTRTIDKNVQSDYDTFSWKEIADKLETAENQESISFNEFKKELDSWN